MGRPLAERAISSAQPVLTRRYSAEERAILSGGTADAWGQESWQTARDFVYPTAFRPPALRGRAAQGNHSDPGDIERALPVAEQRITQLGSGLQPCWTRRSRRASGRAGATLSSRSLSYRDPSLRA
jgi:hypothetical protein